GEPIDWVSVLDGWRSTVDWPGCRQWAEFARLWPDALVVLSVRDPDTWYDSVLESIHAWTAPGKDVGPPDIAEMLTRVWDDEFGGWEAFHDRGHAIACFERHNQHVRDSCPPGRLLEWSVDEGWSPLCEAFGLDEPDEPFPHLNRR
ncbi:MAG TPA: sulfotransferase, partial [Micromonosporaceae bacterium]